MTTAEILKAARELTEGAQRRAPGAHHFNKVANNTLTYIEADGTRAVVLHRTRILAFHPNGSISVDTGGWNTPTTRDRLNWFGEGKVRAASRKGQLYINGGPCSGRALIHADGRTEAF